MNWGWSWQSSLEVGPGLYPGCGKNKIQVDWQVGRKCKSQESGILFEVEQEIIRVTVRQAWGREFWVLIGSRVQSYELDCWNGLEDEIIAIKGVKEFWHCNPRIMARVMIEGDIVSQVPKTSKNGQEWLRNPWMAAVGRGGWRGVWAFHKGKQPWGARRTSTLSPAPLWCWGITGLHWREFMGKRLSIWGFDKEQRISVSPVGLVGQWRKGWGWGSTE